MSLRSAVAVASSVLLLGCAAPDEWEFAPVDEKTVEQVVATPQIEVGPLEIKSISPPSAKVGPGFNVQSNGRSGIGFTTENARPGTTMYFDGQPLTTSYANPKFLTAFAPDGVTAKPGVHEIYLRHGDRVSNKVKFTVEP